MTIIYWLKCSYNTNNLLVAMSGTGELSARAKMSHIGCLKSLSAILLNLKRRFADRLRFAY